MLILEQAESSYLYDVPKKPVGRRGWKLLEALEEPLSAQVVLGSFGEQQQQTKQGDHLEESRDTKHVCDVVQLKETHNGMTCG